MRTLVLWIPDWPVVAAGAEGLLDPAAPSAVLGGREIKAASQAARSAGVRAGMTRRRAQQVCPELALVGGDEAREARAFEAVMQAVEEVVAFPVVLRPGMLLVDAPGPVRHHGGEEELAGALVGVVARENGSEAYVGVADGFLAAVMAARAGIVVPAGGSAGFLAPQSITMLHHAALTRTARAAQETLIQVFIQLGLTTLGALAGIPLADVASRFGALGVQAHALARGEAIPAGGGSRAQGAVVVNRELDPPLSRTDAAAFTARNLATELAGRLGGRTCGRLRVTARTTDGGELTRLWVIEGPLQPADATDRVRWQLDGWLAGRSGLAPAAPLHMLELVAEEVRSGGARPEPLWGRPARSEQAARRGIVRLQGVLGAGGALRPVLEGGRDPRSRVRLVAAGDDEAARRQTGAPWPGQLPAPAPGTVFAEAHPARLTDAAGRGISVDARGQISGAPAWIAHGTERASAVVAWAGPWPVSERWWDEPRRAVWLQVSAAAGPALLLSLQGGNWLVEGAYD